MNSKKIFSLVILILFLAASFYFWYSKKDDNTKNDGKLSKVTIAQFGDFFLYAPLYIAQDKGFFKDHGLDVDIVSTGGDEKTFSALLSGDAQFGVADPTFIAIAGEKGQPGKVIASILSGVPFCGISFDKSIPEINTPSDLNGYSVVTYPAPSTAHALQVRMYQDANLEPNVKEVSLGSLLATLQSGRADIALELEPGVSIAVNSGAKILYCLADYYPDFAITGVTVLPNYLDNNPDISEKVVASLQLSLDYIRNNPLEAAKILTLRFPEVELSVAESSIRNMIKNNVFPGNTKVSREGWLAAVELRKQAGDINKDASYEDYVITTFSEQAIQPNYELEQEND